MMKLLFIDFEVNKDHTITEIWIIDQEGNNLYKGESIAACLPLLQQCDALVGHNILKHDFKYLLQVKDIPVQFHQTPIIDTLWLSSLIFIKHPYHRLIKDYKLDKTNDPIEDAKRCLEVFENCCKAFLGLDEKLQYLLYSFLHAESQFSVFFHYLTAQYALSFEKIDLKSELQSLFSPLFEEKFFQEPLDTILETSKLEFAYVVRLLQIKMNIDRDISILPGWIVQNLPQINLIFKTLLKYKKYDAKKELKRLFNHDNFRSFPDSQGKLISQQEVVESALKQEDLLAIFSTWGGKSLTFQLPALMIAEQLPYLTLVISPLQSLMKDQVDVLEQRFNIMNAGYINSTLSPLERKEMYQKIEFWGVDLLYLSPEMLRSRSTIKLLSKRLISRIVIDEAHCFSKWGHDFRIDYMFIADFIKILRKKNPSLNEVKISCFTATGKQDVTKEIKDYFKNNLGNELREFRSVAKRDNLSYEILESHTEEERFEQLISLLENRIQSQPCIIFARYTGQDSKTEHWAKNIAQKINERLWENFCLYYHGKMAWDKKREVQDKFINGISNCIVATNAFGMGVDKENVRYVVHYSIPSSLENYLQESGRAGRDNKESDCIILYNPEDIDANLKLNRHSELSHDEIKWLLKNLQRAFKNIKSADKYLMKSPKNLVKYSWWIRSDKFEEIYTEEKQIYEVKVKTALYFLEKFDFIKRSFNHTKIRATAKQKQDLKVTLEEIQTTFSAFSKTITQAEIDILKEIYKVISQSQVISIEDLGPKFSRPYHNEDNKKGIKELVNLLRAKKFIESDDEITMVLNLSSKSKKTSLEALKHFEKIWKKLLDIITENVDVWQLRQWNKQGINSQLSRFFGVNSCLEEIDLWMHFFKKKKVLKIRGDSIEYLAEGAQIKKSFKNLIDDAGNFLEFILASDYSQNQKNKNDLVFIKRLSTLTSDFSHHLGKEYSLIELEKILNFLHMFEIIRVESGLFLFNTQLQIREGENLDGNFTKDHYADLTDFYLQKTQQAHIMNEFAQMLLRGQHIEDFVENYFTQEYDAFLNQYFPKRIKEISRGISPKKHDEIYKGLNKAQHKVLETKGNILIVAGPWAWKTKTLVHKVASLILEDGVRNEEFLLLSYSRSAKFELKKRVIDLVGKSAYKLEINTFHWYAFKLLWKEGNLAEKDIIQQAIHYLREHQEIQLPFTVMVLDEFQDINDEQFELVKLIKERSPASIKAIAAGDDDQAIFWFTGGNSKHIQEFKNLFSASEIFLNLNYRSTQKIIDFSEPRITQLPYRLKWGQKLLSGRKEKADSLFGESHIETIAYSQNFLSQLPAFLQQLPQNQKEELAILYHNNETGLLIKHLLEEYNYSVRLLAKDQNDVSLSKSLEFSSFLKSCEDEQNPVSLENIAEKLQKVITLYWENKNTNFLKKAVEYLQKNYAFINRNTVRDFFLWISESDFLPDTLSTITLSTFHKAKGLEFRNVILVLDPEFSREEKMKQNGKINEELVKLIYVAITRAKDNLYLLGKEWNPLLSFFKSYSDRNSIWEGGNWTYIPKIGYLTWPQDIQLSFNYQKHTKPWDAFPIGTPVHYSKKTFFFETIPLQVVSNAFEQKIVQREKNGYKIVEAKVHQRLRYYLQNEDQHSVVYLFDILLIKKE